MFPTPVWVPMRWPAEWRDPALLDLLRSTPVNCLILDWTDPKTYEGVVGPARAAGLALIGLIPPKADARAAAAAAEAMELTAIAGEQPVSSRLPFIHWAEKSRLDWSAPAPALAAADGVWPGVQLSERGTDAGPTGLPWIDSNGWFIRLARVRSDKPLWLSYAPPETADFIRPSSYALAIADAAAHGGQWVLALDPKLRAALADRGGIALDTWKTITEALAFFKAHADWRELAPLGSMGVVSSFSGDDEYFAGEILNLLARRGVPYRIFLKDHAATAPFQSLRGIVYADQEPPAEPIRKRLLAFVQTGGLLLAGAKWPDKSGAPSSDNYRRFNVFKIGKGRLAVAKDDAPDPYLVAGDAQLLLSYRNAPLRLFNTGTLNSFYTGSADGRRAVLHIINYAMRQFGHPVSVSFKRRYRAARIVTLGAQTPSPLEMRSTLDGGIEVHLPPFPIYAAVELEA